MSTTSSNVSREHSGPTMAQREQRLAYLLLVVPILVLTLLIVFPFIWNVILSFQTVLLIDLSSLSLKNLTFTLDNYKLVLGTRGFGELLMTTLIYSTFGTIFPIVLGLISALVARKAFFGRQFFGLDSAFAQHIAYAGVVLNMFAGYGLFALKIMLFDIVIGYLRGEIFGGDGHCRQEIR